MTYLAMRSCVWGVCCVVCGGTVDYLPGDEVVGAVLGLDLGHKGLLFAPVEVRLG